MVTGSPVSSIAYSDDNLDLDGGGLFLLAQFHKTEFSGGKLGTVIAPDDINRRLM